MVAMGIFPWQACTAHGGFSGGASEQSSSAKGGKSCALLFTTWRQQQGQGEQFSIYFSLH